MAIDPTIALAAGRAAPAATPYNPLASYAQAGQVANALTGLQQLGGRNALAGAYANAPIDPVTGAPDSKAVLSNLASDPNGAWMVPQVIQGLQQQQKMQFELNAAALKQTTDRTNTVNSALAPLMRMGVNVTPQDVFGTIAGLHASGMPTDEFVQDAATTLPVKAPGMSDAAYGQALNGWIVNHAARAWPAGVQADKFAPNITTVDRGGSIVTRDTNPYTNPGIANAAPIGKTFTPNEQTDQLKGPMGPNGQPTVITRADYARQNGMGGLIDGGGSGQPSAFPNGGRLPSALMNPNRQGVPGAPTPQAAPPPSGPVIYNPQAPLAHADERFPPPGMTATPPSAPPAGPQVAGPTPGAPLVVGLGPGQQAGATAAGDASAKQWAGLQSSVGGSSGRIYQLQTALTALQADPNGTGPASGTFNNLKSYLQSLPVVGQSLGIDPAKIANYDEANKYLTAYAAARAGRFGGTTDSQLATTLSSNASTHISNLAAQDVVKANIGLERMDQSQLAGFQQGLDPMTGKPTGQQYTPDAFADYASKWNTANDARAFVADHLSPQQFSTMISGMSPPDQAKFRSTFNNGVAQGFITTPAWMTQQPAAPAAAPAASPAAAPAASPPAAPPVQAAPVAPAPTQQAAAMPFSLGSP